MDAISGCSFVIEPDDLWRRHILRRYLNVAPRIADGNFSCASQPDVSIPLASVPWVGQPLTTADQAERADQARAYGVGAEVVFPTFAWSLFSLQDPDFAAACMRAYNVWFSSVASSSPLRFYGAAMIPSGEAGRAEVERCAKMTFRALVIAADSPDILPHDLLGAAAAVNLPVVLALRGSATPATDFERFTRESAGLAEAVSRRGGPHPALIVLGSQTGHGRAFATLTHVVVPMEARDGAQPRLWGHLGQPLAARLQPGPDEAGFLRRNAVELYQLADVEDAKFSDARLARRLAARPS